MHTHVLLLWETDEILIVQKKKWNNYLNITESFLYYTGIMCGAREMKMRNLPGKYDLFYIHVWPY